MTSLVVRDATHLGADRIATSTTAFALYQNLLAAFEGDATAIAAGVQLQTAAMANLAVTEGKLGNSSVGQGKLKTTTAAASQSVNATTAGSIALTGGTYSWWTLSAESLVSGDPHVSFGNGNAAAGVIGVFNHGNQASVHRDERYVTASPPYNLGNGDIPLFVFATVDSGGNIKSIDVAPDPPWAYHGPTDITAESYDRGKAYRTYQEVDGKPLSTVDTATMKRFLAGEVQVKPVTKEITQEIKNRDMPLFPHPWSEGNNLSGLTVVMLDPLSAVMGRLATIAQASGARAVLEIIKSNVAVGNVPLGFTAPPGVMPVGVSLR